MYEVHKQLWQKMSKMGGKHTDIHNDNEISRDSESNYRNGANLMVLSSAINLHTLHLSFLKHSKTHHL